ncbi:MAG TPA: tripartite tricarboxylate transporter permease [Methanomicrobiales archaeon]|nr:tripartite tricarboxylate transporter permease [Methanomicrobiales archaeon]
MCPHSLFVVVGLLLGCGIGICLGTVSGLVPGIHSNTLASVLLSIQGLLVGFFGAEGLAAALFSALITHTFLDSIPSTYLGIPDPDNALSVLPAHALCLEGLGEEAVRIAALGSALAVVVGIPLCILCFLLIPPFQPWLDWGMGIILTGIAGLLIVTAESPSWALALFLSSGLLGLFSFRYSFLTWHPFGATAILLPLLSGLFGFSTLLLASGASFPAQHFEGIRIPGRGIAPRVLLGAAAGSITGWLPGLSNATANTLVASAGGYDREPRQYLLSASAANTVNAFVGLAALYALARTRNGVMVALATQDLPPMSLLLLVGCITGVVAYLLTIRLSRSGALFQGLGARNLNLAVMGFVAVLVFLFTGPFGLLILCLATAVGVVPPLVNIPRLFLTGAIMLPVICFSLGILTV